MSTEARYTLLLVSVASLIQGRRLAGPDGHLHCTPTCEHSNVGRSQCADEVVGVARLKMATDGDRSTGNPGGLQGPLQLPMAQHRLGGQRLSERQLQLGS